MAHHIILLPSILFVTVVTGAIFAAANLYNNPAVECKAYKGRLVFEDYLTKDIVKIVDLFCTVFTENTRNKHNLAVAVNLQHDIFPVVNGFEGYKLLTIDLLCPNKTRIKFTGQNDHTSFTMVKLRTRNCNTYWIDIDTLGRLVNLFFIALIDRDSSFDMEVSQEYFSNSSQHKTLPVGLRNIFNIYLMSSDSSTGLRPIESILTDYEWPVMYELSIYNYTVDSDRFRLSMPKLQDITLNNCDITEPLSQFPWSENMMHYPMNLALLAPFGTRAFMPENIYIRHANYEHNRFSNLMNFTFRGSLHVLVLSNTGLESIGVNTFSHMNLIMQIDISNNRLTHVPSKAFNNLVHLKFLYLHNNLLQHIGSEIFENIPNLLILDLSYNMVETIEKYSLTTLARLMRLDLSYNRIKFLPLLFINDEYSILKEVLLASNNITILPVWLFYASECMKIDVSSNPITWLSFTLSLKSIDLAKYNIRYNVQSYGCYSSNGQKNKMILRDLPEFNAIDLSMMSTTEINTLIAVLDCLDLDFGSSSLKCNCHIYRFYKLIQGRISGANFVCYKPKELHGHSLTSLEPSHLRCALNDSDCPFECSCYYNHIREEQTLFYPWQMEEAHENVQYTVDCSSRNITSLPLKVPKNTEILLASNNSITYLKPEHRTYLSYLRVLDISENILSEIDSSFPAAVSSLKLLRLHNNNLQSLPKEVKMFQNTTITLTDNPWTCDCTTEWMKYWIFANRKYIDIDAVICGTGEGQGEPIVDVPSELFICTTPYYLTVLKTSLSTIIACAAVIVITLLVIYKYRGEIKLLLYMHFNWHPFDRSQEADILDKEYDVFISYASRNFALANGILTFLESRKPPFSACLHDRDFLVGAPIQENIMDSVRKSRRMVIILTQRYLESDWCTLEFRAAHDRVLNDHSNYLILVLAEEIPEEKLEDDMKLYIRTNTYLSLDNKWFYDKLRYVLPEIPLSELLSTGTDSIGSGEFKMVAL